MRLAAASEATAVVIPCRDEARAIARVVASARALVSAVFVIDDGSRDGTGTLAARAGAKVLRHRVSLGKGRALRTGFEAARAAGFSWVLALDGDGQHAPEDIPAFFAAAERTAARMVVGNRMVSARSMPLTRRLVNRWMSRRLSEFCGIELPDSQCGYRLVHLGSWEKLVFHAAHFEVESELLVRFAAAGFSIEFVPVQTRYDGERSKIHPVRDTLRWFRWWRAIRREFASAKPGAASMKRGAIRKVMSDAAI